MFLIPEVETHTYTEISLLHKRLYDLVVFHWRDSPRQERDHEAEPRKEKNSPMFVQWVENRNGSSFSIDRVDCRCLPQRSDFEPHGERMA